MIRRGTVTGREIVKNRDGLTDRLMLQVEMSDTDDIQTVELYNTHGEDNSPIDGTKVIVIDLGSAFKIAIAADDGIVPSMQVGEKKIYSLDSGGAIVAFINYLESGIIEINGNADFAVRYLELETAFNDLKSEYDDLVTKFNVHIHSGVTAGGANTGGSDVSGNSSTADISDAKIDNIKVPGP